MNFLGKTILVLSILGSAALLLGGEVLINLAPSDVVIKKEILTGSTFSVIAAEAGVATDTVSAILESSNDIYNLARIVAGKDIDFIFNKETGEFKKLVYEINDEEKLEVKHVVDLEKGVEDWKSELTPIEYTTEIDSAKGTIETSLYQTIVDQGVDERMALELAETFAWQIDFATQIQKGDSFKVIYEKKYREGGYDRPGKIIAAEFINAGEKFQGFYFEGSDETKEGHYDEIGKSVQKIFLKAPLQYKYISSGFTYKRYNPILDKYTPHRGIDYAAPSGTPSVTIGDGTIIQAGWNGQYGISVKVRHNEVYTTVYGHFSALPKGIRVGARVKQGQVIGYVGSTGLSTGPHLHYEMHKFGSFINPFNEKFPSIEPVAENDMAAFELIRDDYQNQLADI